LSEKKVLLLLSINYLLSYVISKMVGNAVSVNLVKQSITYITGWK